MLPPTWIPIVTAFGIIDKWNNLALIDNEIARYRRKRRRALADILALRKRQMFLMMLSNSLGKRIRKQCQVKRKNFFWEKCCKELSDQRFKHYFRLNRSSFKDLCAIIKTMVKADINMRKAIVLEKRVAVALCALGSSKKYCHIANLFGISKSAVCEMVTEICEAVWKALSPIYMNFSAFKRREIEERVNGFETFGFPQCIGVLDCCNIILPTRKRYRGQYIRSKDGPLVVLLALVDSRSHFIYINVESSGCNGHSAIYESSSLYQKLSDLDLLSDLNRNICNVSVPVFILGSEAFRLGTHLMKPYPLSSVNSTQQKIFNFKVTKTRRFAWKAFDQLKARFRRIDEGVDNEVENVPIIIKACCALQNFLSERNDYVFAEWLEAQNITEQNKKPSNHVLDELIKDSSVEAEKIREALASHFLFRRNDGDDVKDNREGEDGGGDADSVRS